MRNFYKYYNEYSENWLREFPVIQYSFISLIIEILWISRDLKCNLLRLISLSWEMYVELSASFNWHVHPKLRYQPCFDHDEEPTYTAFLLIFVIIDVRELCWRSACISKSKPILQGPLSCQCIHCRDAVTSVIVF